MNAFDQMQRATEEAVDIMRQADRASDQMARIIGGRLRNVSVFTLKKLKKELAQFNAATGQWKS